MKNGPELYFDDPRLHMTLPGRMAVRLVTFAGLALLVALTLTLLAAPDERAFWSGVLIALFLGHQLLHATKGSRPLDMMPKEGRYNLAHSLTPSSFSVCESTLDATRLSGADIRLVLLKKLLALSEARGAFVRLEVDYKEVVGEAERIFGGGVAERRIDAPTFLEDVVVQAFIQGKRLRERYIEPTNLLSGLVGLSDPQVEKLLDLFELVPSDIQTALLFTRTAGGFLGRLFRSREPVGIYARRVRHRTMNRAWTARPTPLLDAYAEDLTDLARLGVVGFLVGHHDAYERLLDVLSRPGAPAALLVGEAGVGKDAIVGHLAYAIQKDEVPPILFDKRLVELRAERMLAGLATHETQGRLEAILQEITRAGNVILYIPDIDALSRTTEGGTQSAADTLFSLLREGSIPVIGSAGPIAYKKYIESRGDFGAFFDVINVPEIDEEEAKTYLTYRALALEKEYRVRITMGAVKEAVFLAHKYFRARPLPASAEDLLKEAMAEAARLHADAVNSTLIVQVAERRVNVPIHKVGKAEAAELVDLEKHIHERYVDQDEAVSAVSRALREYRSGLTRKGGPIASFLFVGPTGVGKTELAKILAELQFGSKDMMVRFDMSEFQERESLTRFIGSSDGAITGALTDAVREKPYSLVLLDEFEKADRDILNLFLQVLDEGRLTDGLGRLLDFKNTMIIATSNAYSEFILSSIESGMPPSEVGMEVRAKLAHFFKPELLNRFSEIVFFRPLTPEDTALVAKLLLEELARDLAEARSITLLFADEAVKAVVSLGYSPTFGARTLRRVIEERLRGELANLILLGSVNKNNTVEVRYENEKFTFYVPH